MPFNKSLLSTFITTFISSVALTGCGSDSTEDQTLTPKTSVEAFVDNFSVDGVDLPYTVLRSDLMDINTGLPFEVRNGGYGSAMTKDPKSKNRFYALTDRGPNATFTGDHGKGKKFPTADYTPRIGLFEVSLAGEISLIKTVLLKRPNGTLITGLPNSSALGGTGETPYNVDGSPVLVDESQVYNENTNPIKLDDYGLDPEGLVALSDGTFWVSDEYGPHMVHFNANGEEIGRINAFTADDRVTHFLPEEFSHRRANRGMEGLAITPDEKTLVGIMQSTMYLPNKSVKSLDITRIVTVDVVSGDVHQYLYKQEKSQNSNSEIAALSATEFLVIERDGNFLYGGPKGVDAVSPNAMKHVYRLDLSTGTDLESITAMGVLVQDTSLGLTINGNTLEEQVLADGDWSTLAANNIVPVEKTLVIDMVAEVNYPHDKMEGLWIIDNKHLGVLNDDDFATWSTSAGDLEPKMLDNNTIDGNHLFIVPVDL
jgi:hypothetical protein